MRIRSSPPTCLKPTRDWPNQLRPVRSALALDWPSVLFLATALVGVWAAYDRQLAWPRFSLIALGLLMAHGIARAGQRWLGLVGLGCAGLAAVISALFWLGYDSAEPDAGRLDLVGQAGLWMNTIWPTHPAPDIQKNAAGGALVLLVPLALTGLSWACARRHYSAALIALACLLIALAGLIISASRGAWLGLIAGTVAAGCLAYLTRAEPRGLPARPSTQLRLGLIALALTALVGTTALWVALTRPGLTSLLLGVAGQAGDSGPSRLVLWARVVALIRDYFFTGSGLGTTSMVYSSYVLLVQVPYFAHAHNLYLQIALGQGVPGLGAFLLLIGWSARGLFAASEKGAESTRWFRCAGLASSVTLLVHGLVDAELYVSLLAPILFLPVGYALALGPAARTMKARLDQSRQVGRRLTSIVIAWTLAVGLAAAACLLPASRATYLANLGAVEQSRAELSVYRWPEWGLQDLARRSPLVNLGPAMAYYGASLALDPTNPTANRRLGQIELSLGQYSAARKHLEAAYLAAPEQRATRLLLGESYAIAGQVDDAARFWRTVEVGQRQLELREAWHRILGEQQQAAWIKQAATSAETRPP